MDVSGSWHIALWVVSSGFRVRGFGLTDVEQQPQRREAGNPEASYWGCGLVEFCRLQGISSKIMADPQATWQRQ